MSIIRNILARVGYVHKNDVKQNALLRTFQAAIANRLSADWVNLATTIDADIRAGGRVLRDRARDLHKNNDYAKRAISLYRTNVVGPQGFKLQMDVREVKFENNKPVKVTDEVANIKIEEAWQDWCKPEHCSVTGRHSFRAICDLLATHDPRDGEAIVHIVYNKKAKYGIQLQVIEPEALDETYTVSSSETGNAIIMGIEMDKWRRPIAYWFRQVDPQLQAFGVTSYLTQPIRIPADRIIHGFIQEYTNQTRGISRLAVSMVRLKMLAGYEEAALVNARTSAAKMGFFHTREGAAPSNYEGHDKDAEGNTITSAEPGIFENIGDLQFTPFTPEYPSAQHEMFVKQILHGIAGGQDFAYHNASGDMRDVNYSSARIAELAERDMWKREQQRFSETYLQPIFTRWLESALGTNNLQLPLDKFDKFNRPYFYGRIWQWVDPEKEVNSELKQRRGMMKSLTEIAAERGKDMKELVQEIAEENAYAMQTYGIDLEAAIDKALGNKPAAEQPVEPQPPPREVDELDELRKKRNGHAHALI